MSDQTSIEWTNRTWNPVRGCSRISEGCRNCYAERVAAQFSTHAHQDGDEPGGTFAGFAHQTPAGPRWTGKVELVPSKLGEPLSWRKPQKVFANSMSDLFHEALSNEDIAAVFGVMAACPRITFQILTKRADRLPKWFAWAAKRGEDGRSIFPDDPADWRIRQMLHVSARRAGADLTADRHQNHGGPWPLPNVWLGVSVENQETADQRIPELLSCPAAVRFVSYEPALGPVNFRGGSYGPDWLEGWEVEVVCCGRPGDACCGQPEPSKSPTPRLDWIIVGGESGPGARPFDIDWARQTVKQCREAGVAVFVKQLGSRPRGACHLDHGQFQPLWLDEDGVLPQFSGKRPADLCHAHGDAWWPCALKLKDRKGGDPSEWPEDLRIREFPEVSHA